MKHYSTDSSLLQWKTAAQCLRRHSAELRHGNSPSPQATLNQSDALPLTRPPSHLLQMPPTAKKSCGCTNHPRDKSSHRPHTQGTPQRLLPQRTAQAAATPMSAVPSISRAPLASAVARGATSHMPAAPTTLGTTIEKTSCTPGAPVPSRAPLDDDAAAAGIAATWAQ